MNVPKLALRIGLVLIFGGAVALSLMKIVNTSAGSSAGGAARTVKVLAYGGFVNSWGPGPELASLFEKKTGLHVEYHDAGEAGLLLRKLDLFPSDLVVGLDQLTVPTARASRAWRAISDLTWPEGATVTEGRLFVPFDWSPLTFVYRIDASAAIAPPQNLDDLANARFKNALALEDPRTTTPGLQFFFWVLDEKGIDAGFKFLASLKPNVHAVYPNWSEAYGAFTKKQVPYVFSYLTSPIYHLQQEKDANFRAQTFIGGEPAQTEYLAVPESCLNCEGAEAFARFLISLEAQKIVMTKNVMLPVLSEAAKGTPFEDLLHAPVRSWKNLPELLQKRDDLFERWRQLAL